MATPMILERLRVPHGAPGSLIEGASRTAQGVHAMTFRAFHALALLALVAGCTTPPAGAPAAFDAAAATAEVSAVLDALHHNASIADEATYFGLFAPEGVFLGTDATERWTVDQFREYAHPGFSQGRGWTYVLREGTRHIAFAPGGAVAWFDEILDNANYGETRGTGVLRRVGDDWKISQYHLTIPVPNALADTVVAMIRATPSQAGP
jgi:hypothetical protein